MQLQRINRTDVEPVFVIVENASGDTILGNYPACFTTTAASVDGKKVVAPAANQVQTFVGFANADIADTAVGKIQAYGYRDSVRIYAHGTSVTIAAGMAMGPGASSNGVSSSGVKDFYGPVISMEAIGAAVNSPGGYGKAFIRAL